MKDSFDRTIDYVRIAVTDRCNLRCFYCMPAEGIPYIPKDYLLSYEEITRLLRVLGGLGFRKVRFTGGEPFLRKDFMQLLENTAGLNDYSSIPHHLQRHLAPETSSEIEAIGYHQYQSEYRFFGPGTIP